MRKRNLVVVLISLSACGSLPGTGSKDSIIGTYTRKMEKTHVTFWDTVQILAPAPKAGITLFPVNRRHYSKYDDTTMQPKYENLPLRYGRLLDDGHTLSIGTKGNNTMFIDPQAGTLLDGDNLYHRVP